MKTGKRKFNIAICGLGGMGKWHRETIAKIPDLHLVGSFDVNPERQKFAEVHGVKPYPSWQALLDDPAVDIVTIATPNDLHRPLAIQALHAGKNVVVEKPAALSESEFRAMADVAEATGMLLTVHQNRRWDDDFRTALEVVRGGELGPVFRVESRVLGCRGIPGDWRQLPEKGGGMILDWGVHLLDQILQMVREPLRTVYATVDHVTNEFVDDGFYADLKFDSGLLAHVEVGTSHFVGKPRWGLYGRDGSAEIDWGSSGRIVCVTDRSNEDAVPIQTAAGLTKTMAPRTDDTIATKSLPPVETDILDYYRNVMDAIDGLSEINVKVPEVLRVLRLMETIRRSAETGRVLPFEEA